MAMHVELVSPEKILFSGEAEMVTCRSEGGDIAFLTGHAPFVGALGIGIVRIKLVEGGEQRAAVHGGFVEVKDNRVIILSDVAELPDQIDLARAQAAKAANEPTRKDDPEADAATRRAETRLEVAGTT